MSETEKTALALADGLRSIIEKNPLSLRDAVEGYLEAETEHLPISERLALLDNLMFLLLPAGRERGTDFAPATADIQAGLGDKPRTEPARQREQERRASEDGFNDPGFARLVSLILGRKMTIADLSPGELSEKLAQAMNTVFDTLNDIVEMIQINLLGQKAEQETIRQIIGSHIGSGSVDNSLQNYLDQIREAFLVAHKAFRTAAIAVSQDLLSELDPEKIAAASEGRLKFGPLRKAELFDLYKEKFGICKGWLESGRVLEGFLREFEKASQKLYKKTV
jgi:hypothetical protein